MKKTRFAQAIRVILGRAPNYSYPYEKYNIEQQVIFVHIPKTAGTSIRAALGAPAVGRKHIGCDHYERSDREKFAGYLKFAVVRDPIDRMYSCFKYLVSGGNGSSDDAGMAAIVRGNCATFPEFVDMVAREQLHSLWPLLWPQSAFVCDSLGALKVDLVLKQEHLETDYAKLLKQRPALPQNLPTLNAAKKGDKPPHALKTRREIQTLYPMDFRNFYPDRIVSHDDLPGEAT